MSNFTQAFLFTNSFENIITLKDENEYVEYYAGDDVLIGDISEYDLEETLSAKWYYKIRFMDFQSALKYVYRIEKDIKKMARTSVNADNSACLESNVIGLHTYVTNLFLQDPLEKGQNPSYDEHYEIDRQLYGYVHDIKEWQRKKETLKNDEQLKKWSEAAGFSELFDRMILTYLEDLLNHVKLMLALMIMRIAPVYSDSLSNMAGELLDIFRYILYNKRVRKIVLDPKNLEKSDKQGSKATTKIEIFFSLSNGDNYCLRLDYGHEGHEYIHLNIDEPGKGHGGAAFPIKESDNEAKEIQQICGEKIDDFFLIRDDCYWFKSGFDTRITQCNLDKENKKKLVAIHDNRTHYKLDVSLWSQSNAEEFSREFAEICIGLKIYDRPFEPLGEKEAAFFSQIRCADDLLHIVSKGMGVAFANSNTEDELKNYGAELNKKISKLIPYDEKIKLEKDELIRSVDVFSVHDFIEYSFELVNKSI